MRFSSASAIVAAGCAALLGLMPAPAAAKCTKLGFSVNDYGKEGPTKDSKELLDKYIADWAKKNNIKGYKVGKKDVSCELFLNLIVVDEHTCTATALVCWPDSGPSITPAPKPKGKSAAAN